MNFGESLTYWYLRLNGFFPLSNFVLHRANIENRPSADTDLLAVRFPHVYEEIGGQADDWDHERFANWGIRLDEPIALIVEVKTGPRSSVVRAWRRERLMAAIQRLGIFEPALVENLVGALQERSRIRESGWVLAKLLVSNQPSTDGPWLNLTLGEAEEFVRRRIERYRDPKRADRFFFPDTLMQYLAWKG